MKVLGYTKDEFLNYNINRIMPRSFGAVNIY